MIIPYEVANVSRPLLLKNFNRSPSHLNKAKNPPPVGRGGAPMTREHYLVFYTNEKRWVNGYKNSH